jgi:hypothetical protein
VLHISSESTYTAYVAYGISGDATPSEADIKVDYQHAWTLHNKTKRQKDNAILIDEPAFLAGVANWAIGVGLEGKAIQHGATELKKAVFDTLAAWWAVEKQGVIFNCEIPTNTANF